MNNLYELALAGASTSSYENLLVLRLGLASLRLATNLVLSQGR